MARPAVSDVAEELYAALGATTVGDEQQWLLLQLCEALTQPLALVDDLASDTGDGAGWSALLDVDRCPPAFLGYLAQFVGATLAAGLDDTSQRLRIASTQGWQRGTPAAIVAAAKQWLGGNRTVQLTERYLGSAYKIRIRVYEAEATDTVQLALAIAAAVPAGILATVEPIAGWTVAEMETETVAEDIAYIEATWATVADFEHELP